MENKNWKLKILAIMMIFIIISFSVGAVKPTPAPTTTSTPAPTTTSTPTTTPSVTPKPSPSATPCDGPEDCNSFDKEAYCSGSLVLEDEGMCNTGSGTCYAQTTQLDECETAYGTCEECDDGDCENDNSKIPEPDECYKCESGWIYGEHAKTIGIPPNSRCCCESKGQAGKLDCGRFPNKDDRHCGDCNKDCTDEVQGYRGGVFFTGHCRKINVFGAVDCAECSKPNQKNYVEIVNPDTGKVVKKLLFETNAGCGSPEGAPLAGGGTLDSAGAAKMVVKYTCKDGKCTGAGYDTKWNEAWNWILGEGLPYATRVVIGAVAGEIIERNLDGSAPNPPDQTPQRNGDETPQRNGDETPPRT